MQLGFGRFFTDHVLIATHDGKGWGPAEIVPAGSTTGIVSGAVQYALNVFEGFKAWRQADGSVRMFRADAHGRRLGASAAGLCMPAYPDFVPAVTRLLEREVEKCPPHGQGSLYVRPMIFAADEYLGVRAGKVHRFAVAISPVDSYFAGRSLRLWAERQRVRACPGGIGWIKTGGNYAASLFAAERAQERGFDQVMWLDAHQHRYLEEAGTMNVFVRVGDRVLTPPAGETVLAGVTRDACITILREWGISVEERAPSLDELTGDVELWGTGTAAGVAPIGELVWEGGSVTSTPRLGGRLKEALENIQLGLAEDRHGWLTPVSR